MRVVYRSRGKEEAELEIHGETHTILNLLVNYLNQKLEKGHAAYRVDHPLKQEAVLYINAGGKNPKDVLVKTIKDLVKDLEKLEEEVIKAAGKPGAEA